MTEQTVIKPEYGNWVSKKLIYGTIAMSILFLGLSLLLPILTIVAAFFLLSFAYFLYARHQFSPGGGNLQTRIRQLVLDHLDWDGSGQALDIGCGNGALAIEIAKQYPQAQVIGIDYWGGMWEYSKEVCERNAQAEGVADQVDFRKASASALPYEDEFFDVAVSNFVFHEVSDTRDKRTLIREALRVVKKGRRFAFQDQFLEERLYGKTDDLLDAIRSWGIESVTLTNTSQSDFIPKALKLPFMVGKTGLIYGTK
jgi:cyclopropane fatty-acyl-phospholipid synthase-like methyltransferase